MKSHSRYLLLSLLHFGFCFTALAQTADRTFIPRRCGTIAYYQKLFKKNPELKTKFEANQRVLLQKKSAFYKIQGVELLTDTIAVAIHVIADSSVQALVTDAVLQSQIDVLNEDYQGINKDSVRIPSAFKRLFGKSGLHFQLAHTNPYGEPTNGIIRKYTAATYNDTTIDDAKFSATGGDPSWDATKYLNIWLVNFGKSGLLGISVFPGDPRPLDYHGFVCDYRAFGRGAAYLDPEYNKGRTTTHEIGHFFNLQHIWGDDDGGCNGTDFPDDLADDDTPNQANATFGDPDPQGIGKVLTDACDSIPPGIMYQNYMDYTDDVAMALFTKGQQKRMESALRLSPDRLPLLISTAYQAAPVFANDAWIRQVLTPSPGSTQCTALTPKVILRNSGKETLVMVQIVEQLNNNTPAVFNWTGNLPSYSETAVTLNTITASAGDNLLRIYTMVPNGRTDANPKNDTATVTFTVPAIISLNKQVYEGFDSPVFPPPNWYVFNPDQDMTWQRNATIGHTRPGSAWFNDFNNATNFRYDDLIMPTYSFSNIDSVFLKFYHAQAAYSNPNTSTDQIDTLSILISKDCGNTFSTVYKKWGAALQTTASNIPVTKEFFPTASQWILDSVNLTPYVNATEPQVQIAFRFNGNYENNIFIDDVNLSTVLLPPLLKERGFLILPTAFTTQFGIWHYQQPTTLRYVNIYNTAGQMVWQQAFNGNADKFLTVNLQRQPAGVYIVAMGYADSRQPITQRIVKY